MKPMLETLNLENDEYTHLIKIGSNLIEQEKKDLKEFLTEFQEVFAWSYKNMLGIDLESTTSYRHSLPYSAYQAKVEMHKDQMAN